MLQDIETFRRNPAVRFDYKYFVDDTPTRYVNAIENVKGSTGPLSYNDDYEYEEDLGKKKGSKKTKMVLAGIGTAFLIMLVILGVFFIVNQNNQSAGEEDTVVVPNFIGMVYQDEILDNEKYADFTFTLQEGNDPEQDPGVVLQQSPNEGIEVKKGREIVLTINQGDEPVKIPEVAGMTEDDAVEALRNMDLIPKVVTVMDEEVGQGYVIETDPAEGSEVDAGSQVTVYVSGGPEENISVPAVIDKSLDAARAEIIAAGLTVGELIPQDDSDKPANTVIETNPLPGVKVASGTKVDITYSSGQQSVKTVEVFLALPDVSNDIDVKVYVDGKLDNDQSGTINPNATSNPGLYTLTFEGTSGTQTLQVTLDGQNYATFTLDFDSGNASQQGSYGNYQPPQDTSSEEENGGGGEAGTGNGGGQGVTRD